MWRVQFAGAGLFAAAVASMVLGPWGLIVLGVAAVAAIVAPQVLWSRWRYEVRDEEIDLRHGLLTVRRTLVPIRRIQHVDTESGPVQGMFDLATVSFHTAAGKTRIPALTRGEAEAVRRRVGELARTRDDV
jgi:membrane protein YdbS with pleckstrin-like domain